MQLNNVCFWNMTPCFLQTLVGDIEQAVKTLYNYHQVWKQYGFTPEIYDVIHSNPKRENYPLRPGMCVFFCNIMFENLSEESFSFYD